MSSPLLVEDDTRLASHQRHTECIVKTFVVIRRKGSRSLQWPMCQLSYIETNRPWATRGAHSPYASDSTVHQKDGSDGGDGDGNYNDNDADGAADDDGNDDDIDDVSDKTK